MNLEGKTVVVVGLGLTGEFVAKFCAARGARVTVSDSRSPELVRHRAAAVSGVARLELGGHETATFTEADLVVMSPGVPELEVTRAARAAGVAVIAEIELAYEFFHSEATLIAITGTNGKSTTTALTGALCAASGQPTFCGGNLGNQPLICAVDHPANQPGGLIVTEVAAFMLENCERFRPKVAVLTNITEDHLDRFGTMEVYAEMKHRIFCRQEAGDVAIMNGDDPLVVAGADDTRAEVQLFSSATRHTPGAHIDGGDIVLTLGADTSERYPISDLRLVGQHNLQNAMASYLAARAAGVPADDLRTGARAFKPLAHRLEHVGDVAGVAYYDDSKGTNVDAVASSMGGFPTDFVLIAGGVDKGGSYAPMFEAIAGKCRGLVLIGRAAPLIERAAEEAGVSYPVVHADDMAGAVGQAASLASAGQAVVLSPACSSYDMFKNFEERGRAFQQAVRELAS